MEDMETNDVEHNYFSNEWTIDRNSKILLCDQLAFLFFADTKTIFTEEEQDILNEIADTMMEIIDTQVESVSVSLSFRCEKLKDDEKIEVLLPLFCFKKGSEEIGFMDHELKVHDTKDIFAYGDSMFMRSNNENNNDKVMFICFPTKSSIEQHRLFQIDHVLYKSKAPTVTELHECFAVNNKSWKTSQKLVRLLFQQFQINDNFVANIINNLLNDLKEQAEKDVQTQVEKDLQTPMEIEEVFNALLSGYREVTGELRKDLGNAYFIKDIQHILHYSNSFKQIKTINSKLEILSRLTLHAKAFVQLKPEEKQVIFHPNSNGKLFGYTISKYRFYFDEELVEAEKRICNELGVQKLDDFLLNGVNILKDLKPFQIIRLFNILDTTCVDFNKTYITLGMELSARLGVNRFEKFDAVMEYSAVLLNDKVSEIKKRNRINNEKRQKSKDRKANKDLRQNKPQTSQIEYVSQDELVSENKNKIRQRNKQSCPRITHKNGTGRDMILNKEEMTQNMEDNSSCHEIMEWSATHLDESTTEVKTEKIGTNTEKQFEKNDNQNVTKSDKDIKPKAERKPNETSHNLTKSELRRLRFEAAAKEIRENIESVCQTFQELTAKYSKYSQGEKYNFADPMLAASHYKKHGKDYKLENLTFEKYLQMAREILSRKNMESTWEQEGRVRSFKSEDKQKKVIAIRKDNTIATLYFPKKM